MMASSKILKASVTTTDKSSPQNYSHLEDQTTQLKKYQTNKYHRNLKDQTK